VVEQATLKMFKFLNAEDMFFGGSLFGAEPVALAA
jgi:hypothetical protein